MSYSATSAAATSSWVDSGLLAQQKTSAPPALSARNRLAVSQVICRHAPSRCPLSGNSLAKRSRMSRSTGICRSAHSIRLRPAAASVRSRTSCSLPLVLGIEILLLLNATYADRMLTPVRDLRPRSEAILLRAYGLLERPHAVRIAHRCTFRD